MHVLTKADMSEWPASRHSTSCSSNDIATDSAYAFSSVKKKKKKRKNEKFQRAATSNFWWTEKHDEPGCSDSSEERFGLGHRHLHKIDAGEMTESDERNASEVTHAKERDSLDTEWKPRHSDDKRKTKQNTVHYVMVFKIQWKPFWLAAQLYPQKDWVAFFFSCELWRIAQAPLIYQCFPGTWEVERHFFFFWRGEGWTYDVQNSLPLLKLFFPADWRGALLTESIFKNDTFAGVKKVEEEGALHVVCKPKTTIGSWQINSYPGHEKKKACRNAQ